MNDNFKVKDKRWKCKDKRQEVLKTKQILSDKKY